MRPSGAKAIAQGTSRLLTKTSIFGAGVIPLGATDEVTVGALAELLQDGVKIRVSTDNR